MSKKSLEDNIDKKASRLIYSQNLLFLGANKIISVKDSYSISASNNLNFHSKNIITDRKNKIHSMSRLLGSLDYKNILNRGYAVIKSPDDIIISSLKDAEDHQSMRVIFSDGKLDVTNKRK